MRYPKIVDLPLQVDATNWHWSKTQNNKFWIGHETNGTKWFVKCRGSFYALRERSTAFLMQKIGINSQSSSFLVLPDNSRPVLEKHDIERYQLAIRYIEEHNAGCIDGTNCPLNKLDEGLNKAPKIVSFLKTFPISNLIDWIKLEVMACLCGANEKSEILFSRGHKTYVIDNEQMFSTKPINPIGCAPCFEEEYDAAMDLTLSLCEQLAKINKRHIQRFTAIPDGYIVNELWSISELMKLTVQFAKDFLSNHRKKNV